MSSCRCVTLALTAIALQAFSFAVAATDRPNFLIIVTDDQGYADLSAYKHHAPDVRTPNMDRLAARGVLFTEAYTTAPVCSPSRAGWTTGRHQVGWDPKSSFGCGLPDNVKHIAEIMKSHGYATARFGKNDYGKGLHRHDVREYPLNHGYDEFLGFSAHGHDYFLLSKDIEKRTPESSLADNTVVLFFSDNGGPPTTGAWNLPLAGSKFTLWEGGIRVPFLLSRPGDPHAGETWSQPISTLDVLPTCLDAAGIELPKTLDGRPISKSPKEAKEPRNLFWRWGGHSYAVRSGDWKLLHNGGRSPRKPTAGIVNRTELLKGTRLFNLQEDPSESHDLAQEHPEVVQQLKKLYADWSKEVAGKAQGTN